MKIFQPMLFVGLGGTGGLIGAELERRVRADLCGPDGNQISSITGSPYQLPDFVQFVYADYSEMDLSRLPLNTPDARLRAAFARTSRVTHNLLPSMDSSVEVTSMLRAALREEISDWLPPQDDEPRITPLHNGAGQLPTVGRAALFGTLRHGVEPLLEPLAQAIDGIARSHGQLEQLGGGGQTTGCDVFVAFSVAGGTGAGIFLDYLYLINQAFRQKRLSGVKIYPLAVMPSAFPPAAGGGREAELNAARSLVDLFRVVDEQNAPKGHAELGDVDRGTDLTIHYPHIAPVRLRPGTVPTAFLFSKTAGIRQDDLRRSIVSLILSLIGNDLGEGTGGPTRRGDDTHQTFASSFINRGVSRAARAASGIGRQGVSTSLVASMTAPLDELAELISGRLLRTAVNHLSDRNRRPPGSAPADLVKQMFADSGLEELWERKALPVEGPASAPRGTSAIENALTARKHEMQDLLEDLRRRVQDRVAQMAAGGFDPGQAVDKLLETADPFLVEQVIKGIPGDDDPVAARGFLGMLDNRAQAPARPPHVSEGGPSGHRIRSRIPGVRAARWGDADVRAALEEQDAWYAWRTKVVWHEAWRDHQRRWQPLANATATDVSRLANAFRGHAEQEPKIAEAKATELYEDRTGISYLLPPQREIGHLYEDLRTRLLVREGLPRTDREAALLLRLVKGDVWRKALAVSRRTPAQALSGVKAMLEARVTRLFAEGGEHVEEAPLLPSMAVLLAAAAGKEDAAEQVSKEALAQFRSKVTALLPEGFTPEGTGPLKVLVVYPRVANSDDVEDYLKRSLRLPADGRHNVECRGVDTRSITVVLMRSQMSLVQVPEARAVLRQWALAKRQERPDDLLRWRQRLGHRDDWLVSTEEDRTAILHRLLCCLWNGQLEVVDGTPDSPERIRLRLFPERGADVPSVRLRLGDFGARISSWAELLHAYERWTVLDDETRVEDYCRRLMLVEPLGLARAGSKPDPLFVQVVQEIAPRQRQVLRERAERSGARTDGWLRPLREFWEETVPAALALEFTDKQAIQPSLATLLEAVQSGDLTPRRDERTEPRRALREPEEDEDYGTTALRGDEVPLPRARMAWEAEEEEPFDRLRSSTAGSGSRDGADGGSADGRGRDQDDDFDRWPGGAR